MAWAPAHHYILVNSDFQKDDLWVATAHGLSHGTRNFPKREQAINDDHCKKRWPE